MSVTVAEHAPDPHVVAAEPEARRSSDNGWVWQVTLLGIALGVMLALAIRTTTRIRTSGLPGSRFGVPATFISRYKDQNTRLQQEIRQLRAKVREFEANTSDATRSAQLLREQLRDLKGLAGLSAVEGPGLIITLRDSRVRPVAGTQPADYLLRDQDDVSGLVSELWAAGAEAIAITGGKEKKGERFVVSTTVREAGPAGGRGVVVNGKLLPPPYRVQAIGNSKELRAALQMPDGFVEVRGLRVLEMIEIQESKHLVLPEYSSSRRAQYAPPPHQ